MTAVATPVRPHRALGPQSGIVTEEVPLVASGEVNTPMGGSRQVRGVAEARPGELPPLALGEVLDLLDRARFQSYELLLGVSEGAAIDLIAASGHQLLERLDVWERGFVTSLVSAADLVELRQAIADAIAVLCARREQAPSTSG